MTKKPFSASEVSDDEILAAAYDAGPGKRSKKRRVVTSDSEDEATSSTLSKAEKVEKPKNNDFIGTDHQWQKTMEMAAKLASTYKVDCKDITMLPDTATIEFFKKVVQAWLSEKRIYAPLTFSTQKTFLTVIARFIFDFVLRAVGLVSNDINITGCCIWVHESLNSDGLHCLHGKTMIIKENVIEMDMTSENGQRALKENPDRTKIVTNRFGKHIVQLKNMDAAYCFQDNNISGNNYSEKSCGLSYTDYKKALQAFNQIMELQAACYPKMTNAKTHMLIPVKCECNWGIQTLLLGRQCCKITPFTMTAATSLDPTSITDPKLAASVNYPSVLVFQCCNPVMRNSRNNPLKSCDFKISAPDMIGALQLAKQLWQNNFSNAAPILIQEFKWTPTLQYRSSVLPTAQEDDDDTLF
nr:MAG: DBP protein [unidentified adenovirus]